MDENEVMEKGKVGSPQKKTVSSRTKSILDEYIKIARTTDPVYINTNNIQITHPVFEDEFGGESRVTYRDISKINTYSLKWPDKLDQGLIKTYKQNKPMEAPAEKQEPTECKEEGNFLGKTYKNKYGLRFETDGETQVRFPWAIVNNKKSSELRILPIYIFNICNKTFYIKRDGDKFELLKPSKYVEIIVINDMHSSLIEFIDIAKENLKHFCAENIRINYHRTSVNLLYGFSVIGGSSVSPHLTLKDEFIKCLDSIKPEHLTKYFIGKLIKYRHNNNENIYQAIITEMHGNIVKVKNLKDNSHSFIYKKTII